MADIKDISLKFVFELSKGDVEDDHRLVIITCWPNNPESIKSADKKWYDKLLKYEDQIFNYVRRELGCFYESIDEMGWTENEEYWLIYRFYRFVNLDVIKTLINLNELVITRNKVEDIMSTRAPYKLWSLKALVGECQDRGIKGVEIEEDKQKLIALLKADDESKKVDDKKPDKVDAKDKVDKKDKKDEKVEDEDEEIIEEDEDEEIIEEDEDENEKPEPKKEKDKPKKDEEAKKPDKKKRVGGAVGLMDQLKKKGLWRKGAQFLTNEEKNGLLSAKNDKERQVFFDLIDKKSTAARKKQSKIMKSKSQGK